MWSESLFKGRLGSEKSERGISRYFNWGMDVG